MEVFTLVRTSFFSFFFHARVNMELQRCLTKVKTRNVVIIILTILTIAVIYTTYITLRQESILGKRDIEHSSQEYFIIPHFLCASAFQEIKHEVKTLAFVRKHTFMRKGEAVSTQKLLNHPNILKAIRHPSVIQRLYDETNMELSTCPRTDENSISVLRYSKEGDGIDEHLDGNVYIGSRWVGLLIVEDDGDAFLTIKGERLPTQPPNTLILFEGDKTKHGVTRRTKDGSRVLINILFCDVCSLKTDIVSKMWSNLVSNRAFY